MKACGFADPPCCWDDVVDWGFLISIAKVCKPA
jgi:hypothetical protein